MKTRTLLKHSLFVVFLLGAAAWSTACHSNATPTTVPLVATAFPTPFPPAPTAPPFTAQPTEIPPTLAVIPTATVLAPTLIPVTATTTGSSSANGSTNSTTPHTRVAPRPASGVYITRLALDPSTPHNKANVTFAATFVNTTGKDDNTTWCVELYRPNEKKSFGISRCDLKTIPPGTTQQTATGWEIAGIRECIPVLARAVVRDELDVRTPFVQPDGKDLWVNFTACP